MSVRLRPMTLADLPAILELEEQLFAPDTWTAAMYRDELAQADTRHYLVVEDQPPAGGQASLVGYGGLIAYDDEAHIATLGVAADRQGEGLGAQLLDALLAEADRRSPVVLLEVRADNEVAQGLYRRRGFAEIGRRRRYYQPSGTDAVVMRRKARTQPDAARGGRPQR
jgi:ribosomal-protein-alanine N-acetyltransferase